eukprot:2963326-Ditylum_brightwellii.AAC.1
MKLNTPPKKTADNDSDDDSFYIARRLLRKRHVKKERTRKEREAKKEKTKEQDCPTQNIYNAVRSILRQGPSSYPPPPPSSCQEFSLERNCHSYLYDDQQSKATKVLEQCTTDSEWNFQNQTTTYMNDRASKYEHNACAGVTINTHYSKSQVCEEVPTASLRCHRKRKASTNTSITSLHTNNSYNSSAKRDRRHCQ